MFDYARKPSMDSLTQVADAATTLHRLMEAPQNERVGTPVGFDEVRPKTLATANVDRLMLRLPNFTRMN